MSKTKHDAFEISVVASVSSLLYTMGRTEKFKSNDTSFSNFLYQSDSNASISAIVIDVPCSGEK